MSKATVQNEAPAHKYFTQMLNIAEDDLDPFQYRLLAHYVRWTGHGGESDESIRQAAKATKMSAVKIRSTLEDLTNLGYIKVDRPTVQEARNGKTIHITIIDRWLDNVTRYQKPVLNMTQVNPVPVSDITHPPVLNMTRLKEQGTEEPNTQRSRVERKREPFYDAIASTFKLTASGQIVSIRSMMQGNAKRGTWKDCNFVPPVLDAQEIIEFGAYMTKRMEEKHISEPIMAAVTIQRWFYDFREAALKATQPRSWSDIPELAGIKEIIT